MRGDKPLGRRGAEGRGGTEEGEGERREGRGNVMEGVIIGKVLNVQSITASWVTAVMADLRED